MEGCRASFPQSLIRYLLGGDGCLPVLVARGTSMKPSAQGGGAGVGHVWLRLIGTWALLRATCDGALAVHGGFGGAAHGKA